MQPTLFAAARWTVTTLTRYIRDALESDVRLQELWVEGEVSNISRPSSGHVYFTLKDSDASLRCVMWRPSAARLELALHDGMAIAVHGKIGVYEVGGQYQLYVDRLLPAGEGALFQEFLRLKAELEAEGLFSPERKRDIPSQPRRIGVVTSASGAALKDVLNTVRRRAPLTEVILAGAAVQGAEAPAQIVAALKQLNALEPGPDVILLVRGGGSIEDLWAFNVREVVHAVAASRTPLISGIGHETDFTLCDFAADLRAPTPTAAAEMATQITHAELRQNVQFAGARLSELVLQALAERRAEVRSAADGLYYHSPARRIQADRQRLDDFGRRMHSADNHFLVLRRSGLEGRLERLNALSPMAVLKRGYAVVTRRSDGTLVRKVDQARGAIHVRVSDGGFDAEVGRRTQSRTSGT